MDYLDGPWLFSFLISGAFLEIFLLIDSWFSIILIREHTFEFFQIYWDPFYGPEYDLLINVLCEVEKNVSSALV